MLKEINWIAVIVATVLVFLLGWVWYGLVFLQAWTAATAGLSLQPALTPGAAMGVGFVNTALITVGLAWVVGRLGTASLAAAVGVSLAAWFFFNFTTMAVDYLYVGLPADLVAINMGYQLAAYLLTGVVLGLFRRRRNLA